MMTKKQKKNLTRIIIAAVLFVAFSIAGLSGIPGMVAFLGIYVLIGYDILRKAFLGIIHGRVLDENFLMAVASVGAIALAFYERSGDFSEAVAVMLFYQVGEWFQSYAVSKSRRNIGELMDIRPDYANLEKDGEVEKVDPDEVEIGSVIVVKTGEKIPIDGIIIEGSASLDTSSLTGESRPRDARTGDEVLSGCINMNGILRIRTTREFGESTASKILDLVENASSNKSKSENFISKFARIYTPAVCAGALALAFIPPIVILLSGGGAAWDTWIYRALVFLVISCPCALVISIPLSFFAGIGGASREGILVKGSNFLETLSDTEKVVFDKTGTLTKGVFEVTEVDGGDDVLRLAAYAEYASPHPIAESIRNAYGKEIDKALISNIKEIAGKGVMAVVDGVSVAVGNEKMMEEVGAKAEISETAGAAVYVAEGGKYAGRILISDRIKDGAKDSIGALGKIGIGTVMLTGDNAGTAEYVAKDLGIDEVHSDLLPAEKVSWIEKIIAGSAEGRKIAFAGDGINDAPVLARADIGIAMGALGSDAAIEAADVVLMDDDPRKIAKAIKIARKCMRIVRENIVFALVVKFLCLGLGAIGIANMWLAIFADVGVMVIAVLNAMRALLVKRL